MIKRLVRDLKREWDYKSLLDAYKDDYATPRPGALRMYVVVRSDILPPLNQGIQAAHAVAEYLTFVQCDKKKRWASADKTLIVLGVKDAYEFNWTLAIGEQNGFKFKEFYEPDIDETTAVAFEPMTKGQAEWLSHLELAS